ncbi:hypothetical protein [Sphaerisporangium siamense]|uniref:SH3 domain-containing protein n=1 Tax=Sphaerisporangium siamense TaxID=795645 RepID=A0A7W7G9P1_9ACTN|nr:hypothetical protein [Sphaerisporangium siamense]MBB4700810.1 hypothetical protein [Sphaerisporangium siamense]
MSVRMAVRKTVARAGLGIAVTTAVLAGTAVAAHAGGPLLYANGDDQGKRWTVCAETLTVRDAPGGRVIGTLYGPQSGPAQSFTIYDSGHDLTGPEWVRGHAYGYVNADGWVQNGWFCLSNGG